MSFVLMKQQLWTSSVPLPRGMASGCSLWGDPCDPLCIIHHWSPRPAHPNPSSDSEADVAPVTAQAPSGDREATEAHTGHS